MERLAAAKQRNIQTSEHRLSQASKLFSAVCSQKGIMKMIPDAMMVGFIRAIDIVQTKKETLDIEKRQ